MKNGEWEDFRYLLALRIQGASKYQSSLTESQPDLDSYTRSKEKIMANGAETVDIFFWINLP